MSATTVSAGPNAIRVRSSPWTRVTRRWGQLRVGHLWGKAQCTAAPAPHRDPGEAPSPQQWTIADTRWPRVKRYTSATDPTMVVESVNSPSCAFRRSSPRSSRWMTTSTPSWTRMRILLSLRSLSSVEPHLSACAMRVKLPTDDSYQGMSWSFLLHTRRATKMPRGHPQMSLAIRRIA